jgi:hypothetical protein
MNGIMFSTLACPGRQLETIISKTDEFGYEGIQWRGGPDKHVGLDMTSAQTGLA